MRKIIRWMAALALGAGPMAGGALAASPPPNGGTVSIAPRPGEGSSDASIQVYVDAVSKALTARGFTVFEDQGHAASTIELLVSRADVGTGLARVAGQSKPSMAGTGVAIPLSTGASEEVPLRRTRLEMRVTRRGEPGVVWDGAAVTVREAGSQKGNDAAVAADLLQALLQAYPNQPRDVIGVP